MSTKELYTALLTARMDTKTHEFHRNHMIHETDEAILEWIAAERKLNGLIIFNEPALLRRRLKLILCEEAAKQCKPIEPADVKGSEAEQLKAMAIAAGCPKITAWME